MPLFAGWSRVGGSPQPQTLAEMTIKPSKVTVGGKLPLGGSRDIDDRRRSLGGDLGEFQIWLASPPASSVKVAPHLTLGDGFVGTRQRLEVGLYPTGPRLNRCQRR